MKKFLTTLPLLLLSASCFLPTPVHADTTTGLVGYWTFNGGDTNWNTNTTNDASGNGHTGMMRSMSTTTSPVMGKMGQGFKFNDVHGGIDISSYTWTTQTYTLNVWAKLASTGGGYMLVSNSPLFILDTGQDAGGNGQMSYYDGAGHTIGAIGSVPTGSWVMLTWVLNSGTNTGTAYINGVSMGTAAYTPTNIGGIICLFNTYSNNCGTTGTNGNGYSGSIFDDVRIYNRALSATDVMQLYKQGASKNATSPVKSLTSGLVGYWTFDGKDTNWTTNTTNDLSGQGNTAGFILPATTTMPVIGKIGQAIKLTTPFQGIGIVGNSSLDKLASSTMSFSMWVKISPGNSSSPTFIAKADEAQGTFSGWYAFFNASTDFVFKVPMTTLSMVTEASLPTGYTNKWIHIVVTWDGSFTSSNVKIYMNGVLAPHVSDQNGSGGQTYDTGKPVHIGCYSSFNDATACTTGSTVLAAFDDVRIYNRILSQQEVTQLYKQGGTKYGVSPVQSNTSGLVGYWTFDGKDTNWTTNKTNDLSGQGNTGTLVNISTTTSPVMGKVGQALKFNGTSNYVNVPWNDSAYTTATPMTFSVWAKSSIAGTAYADFALVADVGTYASQGFSMSIEQGTGKWVWNVPDFNGFVMESSSAVVANTWYHLVGTFDGTTAYFYINGVQVASRVPSGTRSYTPTGVLRIGTQSKALARYFSGSIDDLRIYNRALSATEVAQLYKLGTGKSR